MSLRFLFHLLVLCVAAVLFVVLPEQRFAAEDGFDVVSGDDAAAATESDEETETEEADGEEPEAVDDGFWDDSGQHASRGAPAWPGLHGRVLDLEGELVPGLTFHLAQQRAVDPRRLEGAAKSLHAVSDFDGRFEILVADAPGELTLSTPEWVLLGEWRREKDQWRIDSDVLVTSAVTVAGRVTRADGSGVAAKVRAGAAFQLPQSIETQGGEPRDGFFSLECRADAQGYFTLGRVPQLATTRLHVRTPEGVEQILSPPEFAPGDMRIVLD